MGSVGSRVIFVFLTVVTLGVAVIAFGQAARADDSTVDTLALDTDVTGNTATSIATTETCASVASPGSTINVDIVVNQVPSAGTQGFSGDVFYNPAVLKVTGADYSHFLMASGGTMVPIDFSNSLPDTDGDYRMDIIDFSDFMESGPGVLVRLTFTAVGNGNSSLIFGDTLGDTIPDIFDQYGSPYPITNVKSATVNVGQSCQSLTDVEATSATVSAPATADLNVPFNVTAGGGIGNDGPISPVIADAAVTLNLPPDCTASGGNVVALPGITLVQGSPHTIAPQAFSVTCANPSFHTFTSAVSVTLNDPTASEIAFGNNQVSSASVTTPVVAHADLLISSVSVSTAQTFANPMAGITFQVVATVAVGNNGPAGPVGATGTASLTKPSDCDNFTGNPNSFTANPGISTPDNAVVAFTVSCQNPGTHSFSVSASVSKTDVHVVDAPGNNSGSGSTSATLKVGACGADPNPAGNLIQNLSPQLLLLISSLTATGTPVADNLKQQLDCNFQMTVSDAAQTPIDECAVQLVTEAPCTTKLSLSIDAQGGSPVDQPTVRLNPIGVTFLPAAFDWANDTEVPNGTIDGSANFGIRTDGGLVRGGVGCQLDIGFPTVAGREGGIQGNVPDSNNSADLTNPNVWPNDLNAERALVESSFAVPIIGGSGVTLWSRTIVPLSIPGLSLTMNILTWKVTNPVFQAMTGALWVVVPFPGDAVNPDPAGSIGGNPDSDDPPAPLVPLTYCTRHNVTMTFDGMAGNTVFLACHQPGSQMGWNLVDPDALNITGDEGPRSDTSNCGLDADSDGLSANAETYWGTNALSADTDADGTNDGADNCKTTPNADQSDLDHDGAGDACDPDKDGDGILNASDNCPNASNANQADYNNDGVGDACDPCQSHNYPWATKQPDSDCDGWTNSQEGFLATDPAMHCAATPAANDETSDAWPVDLNNDQHAGPQDVLTFVVPYGHHSTDPQYRVRNDFNGDGQVGPKDVLMIIPFYGKSCT